MSRTALSIYAFVVYMVVTGVVLVAAPNLLNDLLLPTDPLDPRTMRLLGVIVLTLSYYYAAAARSELTEFMAWTVHGRLLASVGWAALVLLGLAPGMVGLFIAIELASAAWTWMALRWDL